MSMGEQSQSGLTNVLRFVLTLGFGIGLGISTGLSKNVDANASSTQETPKQEQTVNSTQINGHAEFQQMTPGQTTLLEAQIILGRGKLLSSSTEVSSYRWKNPDGSRIDATFSAKDQVLKEVKQEGLN